MANYIYDYYDDIQAGRAVAGKWLKLIYAYLVRGLERKDFYYDAKKANKAVKFIENFCHHSEGRSDLIKLERWQKAAVAAIFAIVDEEGYRQFREVFIIIGRKNGKSLLVSAILAYIAYLDGEYGANIYCMAPKLEQAAKVYEGLYQMIISEPELDELAKRRRSDIYIKETNTTIKPLAFNAKKSDGFNPQATSCDELAAWPAEQGLKQYEVMKSALGARKQPLIISITTANYINDGPYDELVKRATALLVGNSYERRLLPIMYMIDDVGKWDDIEELKKANPNINVSVSEDFFREEIAVARNSLPKKAEFLTKYCNIKQSGSFAWLSYQQVEALVEPEAKLEDFRGCYCVGGIDLSQTTDLTAACVVIEKNNKLYSFAKFFMPANKVEELQEREGVPYELYIKQGDIITSGENYVDYKDVYNWYVHLVNDLEIYPLQIGYDRYSAQYLIKDLEAAGFHVDDVYQGENLTPVLVEAEGLIDDKTLRLCSNNVLKMHFLNVAMKVNTENRKKRPVKIEQRAHIDGFVAVIDALTVRQKWYEDIGGQLKNDE